MIVPVFFFVVVVDSMNTDAILQTDQGIYWNSKGRTVA